MEEGKRYYIHGGESAAAADKNYCASRDAWVDVDYFYRECQIDHDARRAWSPTVALQTKGG